LSKTRRGGPEATKADVLRIAQDEFATRGLAGARVDAIAARTKTTKRAIYYHFGSKTGLYIAVLEKIYKDIRDIEGQLGLKSLPPDLALRKLVEFTFDYDEANADFVRLVSNENINSAKYLARSPAIRNLNAPVIDAIADILARGRRSGIFRDGVEAIDVHMVISALCFFRVANRHTFLKVFRRDLLSKSLRNQYKRIICDTVLRSVMR